MCHSLGAKLVATRHDDRYGYPGSFSLLRCSACAHVFLQGEFRPEMLRDLYSNYYPRSTYDLESHHPYQEMSGLRAWFDGAMSATFRWVPRNVRILDIGCGFGESLGYHQARGCEVYGVEADENIRRVADRFRYKVHVGLFDPDVYEADFFDYVTMSQVIEHVTDPTRTLQGIKHVLKPGGTAILSTPSPNGWGARMFGQRWINWHTPYHQQFFSVRSMRLAAEKAGLSLDRTKTITPSAWLRYQWIHLFFYPKEGMPSPVWAPGIAKSRIQRTAIRALNIAHYLKLNHFITRLFDAMGVGDNRLYFLRKP